MTQGAKRKWYDDDVNGTIIGAVTFPYQFHIRESRPEYQDKRGIPFREVARGFFESDEQAIAWFKEHYPSEYASGVEMRVFDRV